MDVREHAGVEGEITCPASGLGAPGRDRRLPNGLTPSPQTSAGTPPLRTNENLNAVLWMQTSAEYRASAQQAYRLAAMQLDTAMRDARWTAAVEQTADPSALPPAVILDLDETVLDNSAFEARQMRDGQPFSEEVWDRWCEERACQRDPGRGKVSRVREDHEA